MITPPYDLNLSARLMSRYHGVLESYTSETGYTRAIAPAGQPVLFRAYQPEPDTPLQLTYLAGSATQTAHRILCLHDDFRPFYAIAREDARLWAIVAPLYGLHHFQSETVFEALIQVIIEQQISLYAALKAQRALVEWGQRFIDHEGGCYYQFPTPTQLADANPVALHQILKITRRRVAVIQSVAQDIVAGDLDLERLRTLNAQAAYADLMAIKGIGHWTAAWTLIRGLSYYDYAAHNDVALRDAVAYYFYDTSERVSAEAVAEVFANYAPYSGLAAFYTLMAWAVAHY